MPCRSRNGVASALSRPALAVPLLVRASDRFDDDRWQPELFRECAREPSVLSDHPVDFPVTSEQELEADSEPMGGRVACADQANARDRASQAAHLVLVLAGLHGDVVAEPLGLLVRIRVTADVHEQRRVVDADALVVGEVEKLGEAERDQALPEHVLHGLAEAQIDAERERRDQLRHANLPRPLAACHRRSIPSNRRGRSEAAMDSCLCHGRIDGWKACARIPARRGEICRRRPGRRCRVRRGDGRRVVSRLVEHLNRGTNVPGMATKPDVTIPDAEPPAQLQIEDLEVGDGTEATPGSEVEVHYVGVAWSNGSQFDASWDRNDTFSFRLGAGQVISGWDDGVAGMRVGGRRRLTIPPHLGYGSRGAGGVIRPDETLVFVVDLLGVR
jgi:peptidylprolyl isomerase